MIDDGKKKAPALLSGFGGAAPEDDSSGDDAGALAGSALIKAIKSGDGAAVYSAFEALKRECESKESGDALDESEEMA